ncbi:hypothetical protein CISIN_1g033741mg [Citrus sinensis]|uniref:Uncharacterized protein n=1 Tax=Citrus sinensis TaxID=2711 RepID=A0A067E3T9_CITSI|nr:hypothetical protein CISIN_1g033741mg [Citrus sinensis]
MIFLVIGGINQGLICGHYMKKDESYESEFKDTISVFLPLRNGAIIDIESIQILTSPLTNKVCPSKGTISSFTCSQGATRHMTTQKKSMMEIESVGAAGKYDIGHVKKYFRGK